MRDATETAGMELPGGRQRSGCPRVAQGHRGACLVLLPALMLLAACQTAKREDPLMVRNGDSRAIHAVESEELKGIMRQLRGLTFDRMPQELDRRRETEVRLKEVVAVAESMAEAASRIPESLGGAGLGEEDGKLFLALAGRLKEDSRRLSAEAGRLDLAGVDARLGQINSTCVACHTLFRNPSTPLPNLR